ncbi:hypothetical protein ONR75_18310 [Rhodopseudomonas sp. P2A-2r]|uniref:hypothetical protein n=1 Tax=Rhodopseudomonas sp. P2A-2r TaxID=2991972 RepID=UPI002234A356|nr:hypothetical protein [Rhodopseudomonas sp. P2A-2r]UZE46962.1 hypothetical protein ONR75_18310 [Rhodopseudomonas sp. P2A-2r]
MPAKALEEDNLPIALRSWLLASLRFAVTLQNEDKLVLLAVAAELDKHGIAYPHLDRCFNFFQRTSVGICQAIIGEPDERRTCLLHQHLARIPDERLRLAFAAAVQVSLPIEKTAKPRKPKKNNLWKGLSSRPTGRITEQSYPMKLPHQEKMRGAG